MTFSLRSTPTISHSRPSFSVRYQYIANVRYARPHPKSTARIDVELSGTNGAASWRYISICRSLSAYCERSKPSGFTNGASSGISDGFSRSCDEATSASAWVGGCLRIFSRP